MLRKILDLVPSLQTGSETKWEGMKVREVIKLIEKDGRCLVKMQGDRRQYKHPEKSEPVTISGNLGRDMPPGTLNKLISFPRSPWEHS